MSRGPLALLAPDTPHARLVGEVPTGWVPGGREATPPGATPPGSQAKRSHASWKPPVGVWQVLVPCGDTSGARLVLSRAVGWGEETGWSEPLPFLGSGAAPIKSEATEAGAPRTVALTEKSGPQPPGWLGSIEASGQGSRSSLGPGWWGSVQARVHQQQ